MIAIKQLAHACIFSGDLDRTRDFYAKAIGLGVAFNFVRSGEVIGFYLDVGRRSHIEVFHKSSARFAETDRINHLCLEVEDMDAAIAHLRSLEIDVTDKKRGCDDTWQAWTADPDGVKIELFQYTDGSAQFVGGDRIADW